MNEVTPEIAEDIQMLANFWLEAKAYDEYGFNELKQFMGAAQRVEAYLSTFKPDYL